MNLFYVYLLRCKDGSLYCGYTNNLERRIFDHNNSNTGAKYTKNKRPVVLVYKEEFNTKSAALRREIEIKKMTKSQKENIIANLN